MVVLVSVPQAPIAPGASPIKDCPNAASASFFLFSFFLTTMNFHSCRLLAEGESLAASSIFSSFSSSTSVFLYALTLLLWSIAVETSIFAPSLGFSPQRRRGRKVVIFYLAVRGRQIKGSLECQNNQLLQCHS